MDNWNALNQDEKSKRTNLQIALEQDLIDYSIKKYWKSYNDDPSSGTPEQELIYSFVEYASEPFRAWVDFFAQLRPDSQTRTAGSHWSQPLLILEPETLAAIVITEILQTLLHSDIFPGGTSEHATDMKFTFQKMAARIGKQIKLIVGYRTAKATFADDWKRQSSFLKNWEPKRCDAFAKKFETLPEWTPAQCQDIGTHLLHIASKSHVINVETRTIKGNRRKSSIRKEQIITLEENLMQELMDRHALQMLLRIIYRPMLTPPVDHTMELAGGTIDLSLRKNTVDGMSRPSQADLDALNAMQATEWSVNTPVMEIMDTMFRNNWETCNLPPKDLEKTTFPSIPDDADPQSIAKIKGERAELWAEWYKSEQKRLQMDVRLRLAKELDRLGFFYHNYTMDFRGRAYSVCTLLSPQSGDFDRGLIKFSSPTPVDDRGLYWIKVNLANLMDGAPDWNGEASDKAPFDERAAWVDNNHDMLLQVADNPLELASLWCDNETTKKNPSFQRIAAIMDYALAVREGVSEVPVQLDGACNGSQHWSAIRRDEKIAKLTNVMPGDRPQDLYQYVADIATQAMIKRAGTFDEPDEVNYCQLFCEHWDNQIKRKVVKRATMCDAYGITSHGIRKYVREEGHLKWLPKELLSKGVNELGMLEEEGLAGAMVESNLGKEYVRYLSDQCSLQGKPLQWSTVTGFRVVHKYPKYDMRISKSQLYNKAYVLKASFGMDTGLINDGAAYTGIAPNYIHSHDAAHMRLAILDMKSAGITQFSMIHDSYGCPASQVEIMRGIIKETFYEIHETIQLETIYADVAEQLERDDLERPPAVGQLDISCVLDSEYLFG